MNRLSLVSAESYDGSEHREHGDGRPMEVSDDEEVEEEDHERVGESEELQVTTEVSQESDAWIYTYASQQAQLPLLDLNFAERGGTLDSLGVDMPVDIVPPNSMQAVSNIFETPPDRVRHDPLNFVLSRLDEGHPDSTEAMIVNLLRNNLTERYEQRTRGTGYGTPSQPGSRGEVISGRNYNRDVQSMLPSGLEAALNVYRPTSLHEDLMVFSTLTCDSETPTATNMSSSSSGTVARVPGTTSLNAHTTHLDGNPGISRELPASSSYFQGRFSQIGTALADDASTSRSP